MKKITFLFMLLSLSLTYAQVGISADFETGLPTGWSTDEYFGSTFQACEGTSFLANIYGGVQSANLTTDNQVGISNETDLSISFDYRIVDYYFYGATAPGWGTAELQYSTDNGSNWITVLIIDDSNHVSSASCAPISTTIPGANLPMNSDVQLRILNTWATGDYWFYVDNFQANQVATTPPNCDSVLVETTNVPIDGTISWTGATGVPTGYRITAGSSMGGNDLADNVDVGNVSSYALGTLMPATTYYVTITPYNANGVATGCTEQTFTTLTPPVNDLPSGALPLTLDEGTACGANSITGISNEFTSDSGEIAPTCGAYNGGDLWYTFVAPASGIVTLNTENVTGISSIAGTYYSGTPGSFVDLGCRDFNLGWPWELTGLTSGETYYLRLWDFGNNDTGTFDLCGYFLSCTSGVATAETTTNCPSPGDMFDVVVTFSEENDAIGVNDGTTTYPISGGVATAGPYNFGDSRTLTVVHGNSACDFELGTYQIDACPPANDNCSTATELTPSVDDTCTGAVAGTTIDATAGPSGCLGTADDDVWYRFTATQSAHNIVVTNSGGSSDIVTQVFDACGGTQITCQDTPNSPIELTGLSSGNEYFFRIYTWSSNTATRSSFDVCVTSPLPPPPPPANDDPSGAEALTVGVQFSDNQVTTTNISATASEDTDSSIPAPGCSSYSGGDVWYTVMAPASGTLIIETNRDLSSTPVIGDTGMAVYSGAIGAFVLEGCDDDDSPDGAHALIEYDLDGADSALAGQLLYVRVFEYSNNAFGTWFTSAYSPLPNDDCAGAIELTLGAQVSGTTVGATDSGVGTTVCDATGTGNDLWYSFVAPTSESITIATTAQFVVVYDSCGGTEVGCGSDGDEVGSLTDGVTYFVRVYNDGTVTRAADGPFTLTVSETTFSNGDFDSETGFTYYPNPVKNTLNLNAQQDITDVVMYNMLGQQVMKLAPNTVSTEVDMTNLNPGAYFVRVSINDTIQTIRIIKE